MIESTPPIMKAGDATLMLGEKTTRLMRMSTGTIQANAMSSRRVSLRSIPSRPTSTTRIRQMRDVTGFATPA